MTVKWEIYVSPRASTSLVCAKKPVMKKKSAIDTYANSAMAKAGVQESSS
jgi:hypothetical protein